MGYYIEQVSYDFKDQLEKQPKDMEVEAAERKDRIKAQIYNEVTQWSKFSGWLKLVLALGTTCMIAAVYIYFLFGSYCFREFLVTNEVGAPFSENGLDGNVINIVKAPWGWTVIFLFAVS